MLKKTFYILAMVFSFSNGTMAQNNIRVKGFDFTHCDTTGFTTIYMMIQNVSSFALPFGTSFDASYRINGEPPVTETFSTMSVMNPYDSAVYHFNTKFRFNEFITYNGENYISCTTDMNHDNDTDYFAQTFLGFPGYHAHSSDTAICQGSPVNLMMEFTGNSPWTIDYVTGTDTVYDYSVIDSLLEIQMAPDTTTTFTLLQITDVNGCFKDIYQGITVTVGYPFFVNLGSDTSVCAGQSLLLDAGFSGALYNWHDGSASQTFSADTSDWDGAMGMQSAWVIVSRDGCTESDTINVEWIDCSTGIEEIFLDDFQIYPDPSTGTFTIDFGALNGTVTCNILNSIGQVVHSEIFSNVENNNIQNCTPGTLKSGLYFIVIQYNNKVLVKKLIME
jgi:hypothetical protein